MPEISDQKIKTLRDNYRIGEENDDLNSLDLEPVVKIFDPCGPATWLLTELSDDEDTAFGLCDLGLGFPELGPVSLSELDSVENSLGMPLEVDRPFKAKGALRVYNDRAREAGRIVESLY